MRRRLRPGDGGAGARLPLYLLPLLRSICLIKGAVLTEGWAHLWVPRQENHI